MCPAGWLNDKLLEAIADIWNRAVEHDRIEAMTDGQEAEAHREFAMELRKIAADLGEGTGDGSP